MSWNRISASRYNISNSDCIAYSLSITFSIKNYCFANSNTYEFSNLDRITFAFTNTYYGISIAFADKNYCFANSYCFTHVFTNGIANVDANKFPWSNSYLYFSNSYGFAKYGWRSL
jgi:hypothetical protein